MTVMMTMMMMVVVMITIAFAVIFFVWLFLLAPTVLELFGSKVFFCCFFLIDWQPSQTMIILMHIAPFYFFFIDIFFLL